MAVDENSADAATTQEPTSSMVRVANNGDVDFLLQTDKNSTTIRVSSVLLEFASPVFGALLGPLQGQAEHSEDSPKEILLVDDNSRAMVDLCSILHHKQTDLQELDASYHSTERLLELCVIADKYGCGSIIALAVEALFSRFLHGGEFELNGEGLEPDEHFTALLNLTTAAYILRLRKHFRQYSRILVLEARCQYFDYVLQRTGETLPLWVICEFYEFKNGNH